MTSSRLHDAVNGGLERKWSLDEDYPEDPEMRVSPETSYQTLYLHAKGELRTELKLVGIAIPFSKQYLLVRGRYKDLLKTVSIIVKGSVGSLAGIGAHVHRVTRVFCGHDGQCTAQLPEQHLVALVAPEDDDYFWGSGPGVIDLIHRTQLRSPRQLPQNRSSPAMTKQPRRHRLQICQFIWTRPRRILRSRSRSRFQACNRSHIHTVIHLPTCFAHIRVLGSVVRPTDPSGLRPLPINRTDRRQ